MNRTLPTCLLLVLLYLSACQQKPETLFSLVPPEKSGVTFANTITETENFNVLVEEYIYNGGGVAVADFNADGLPDLFFTGNQVNNALYLNQGNMRFEDASEAAGVQAPGRWCAGATVVDIDQDGLPDLYVAATLYKYPEKRKNLLFVNEGSNAEGVPVFRECAESYGLADDGHTTHSAFFDYDRDGDLDAYLLTNVIDKGVPGNYRPKIIDGTAINNDRLYKNNGDGTFTNVSQEAGIRYEGHGLGLAVSDINQDGWPDLYITNDYLSNDLLYINNQDGTFSNQLPAYTRHQSHSAMGNNVVDLNHDGLVDIIALDMLPETNQRKKQMMGSNNYISYINNEKYGYQYQVVRNTLQLNQGFAPSGHPVFSEVGQLTGLHQTDWSWTPLVSDFDHDGQRDIIITNGFPKDVTDKDFVMFFAGPAGRIASKMMMQDSIPVVKLANYAFKSLGDLKYEDVTTSWGMDIPSFSNGAVYADLDNDGDLDVVASNIDDPAFIYENHLMDNPAQEQHNYLRLNFEGEKPNREGLGAKVWLRYGDKLQYYEHSPSRGYISSVEPVAHFGLGGTNLVDTLLAVWPGGQRQLLTGVATGQRLVLKQQEADTNNRLPAFAQPANAQNTLLKPVTAEIGLAWRHKEDDLIDFNLQRTLPHKFSQLGPALAAGDVNGDQLDDLVAGGSAGHLPVLFVQQANGSFVQADNWLQPATDAAREDLGMLLFDADNDGDNDLYICSGSIEFGQVAPEYQDRLYLNNGQGEFACAPKALPENLSSTAAVKAADFNGDGLLDLFVGGRVKTGAWPEPVSSFILKNEGGTFVDVTARVCPELQQAGLVTDALWSDFDNDGLVDLLIAGEWMPIRFFKNTGGRFEEVTAATGIADKTGWWNSLAAADFDSDGDIDYVAGNLGLNTWYKGSSEEPMQLLAKDFDNSGSMDPVISVYLKDRASGESRLYPIHSLNDIISQMQMMRKRFQRYKYYGQATTEQLFLPAEREGALEMQATHMASSYIENLGNGQFRIKALPGQAQFAPVTGLLPRDVNTDGHKDLVLVGNNFGGEVFTGRYDALNGLVLLGDGQGNFRPLSMAGSGFFVPGDARALVALQAGESELLAASRNRDSLVVFSSGNPLPVVRLMADEARAVLQLASGKQRVEEFSWGAGYLSQSGRYFVPGPGVTAFTIYNSAGKVTRQMLQ